jgi:PST family polysaccharide transporter
MIIKMILFIASFLALIIVILLFDKFTQEWKLYLLTFGIVLGQAIFPLWFFQGLEKMKYIMAINILAKILFTISIFIFIHDTAHYIFVPLIQSSGFIFAGLLALYLIRKRFKIRFIFPAALVLKKQLSRGWNIFLSSVSSNIYKTNDIFILGIFGTEEIVGYYVIAKKLIDISNQFAVIISQVIFPYISNTIKLYYQKVIQFLKSIFYILAGVTLTIGLIFLLFPEQIVYLVAGETYPLSIQVLKILAFVPLIIGINVPAVQIFLGSGKDKIYSRVLIAGGIMNTILTFSLIPFFSHLGACFAVIGTEIFVTAILYITLKMNIAHIRS